MNFLPADQLVAEDGAEIGVRPEAVTLLADPAQAQLAGRVEQIEDLGHEFLVHLRLDTGGLWAVRLDMSQQAPKLGQRLGLHWASKDQHDFDAKGNHLAKEAPQP